MSLNDVCEMGARNEKLLFWYSPHLTLLAGIVKVIRGAASILASIVSAQAAERYSWVAIAGLMTVLQGSRPEGSCFSLRSCKG